MPTHIYLKTNLYSGPITQHYLYGTWHGIKSRCFNPKCKAYKNYGGVGITIFQEWINDSAAFFIWIDNNLGKRPEGYSLDRINSHGNYEPENLRWASASTQKKNIRNPEEWKRNLSKANKGKKLSEETKNKFSLAQQKIKEQTSNRLKTLWANPDWKERMILKRAQRNKDAEVKHNRSIAAIRGWITRTNKPTD